MHIQTGRIACSSLSTLAALDVLDSLVGSLATSGLLLLGALSFLSLEGLLLAILDLLGGGIVGLVAILTALSLAATDLLDGHANDGLLDAGGLARSLLLNIVNFNLLVIGSSRSSRLSALR